MESQTMPAAFLGHGSPRITFQQNVITESWRSFSASFPRPRAIIVVSAHWFINASAVTAMERPRTVHDFYYAPKELYEFTYACPGAPWLVEEMIETVKPTWLGPDYDTWGLDHGAWSLLAHLYPEADIPVVQLAINASLPPQFHVDLGAQLAPLRAEGILILGSGNIIHNGHVASEAGRAAGEFERAERFEHDVEALLTSTPSEAAKLVEHPDFRLAAPTDDHFVPVFYFAGLAAAADERPSKILDGPAIGSIGMSAYAIGL